MHASSTPPTFVLSQDQTLHLKFCPAGARIDQHEADDFWSTVSHAGPRPPEFFLLVALYLAGRHPRSPFRPPKPLPVKGLDACSHAISRLSRMSKIRGGRGQGTRCACPPTAVPAGARGRNRSEPVAPCKGYRNKNRRLDVNPWKTTVPDHRIARLPAAARLAPSGPVQEPGKP